MADSHDSDWIHELLLEEEANETPGLGSAGPSESDPQPQNWAASPLAITAFQSQLLQSWGVPPVVLLG